MAILKAAALVGALLIALAASASAHARRNLIVGVNDYRFTSEWERASALAAPLNLTQIAVPVRYRPNTELGDPLGQIPSSQPMLAVVSGLAADTPATPEQRAVFCEYVKALVLKYRNIRQVQIWNEPDLDYLWRWDVEYIPLLAQCFDTLRGTGVVVLGPGFSPNADQFQFVWKVNRYYKATKRKRPLMHGYAVHPYWGVKLTEPVAESMNLYWRKLPQRSPKRGLRFWWTETGWESTTAQTGYMGTEVDWLLLVSPEEQARRLRVLHRRAYCAPFVAAVFNFLLVDEPNLGRWQSGLYYLDGTPKPAFDAYKAVAHTKTLRCGAKTSATGERT